MSNFDKCMEKLERLSEMLSEADSGAADLLSDLRDLHKDILWTRTFFLICWFGFFVPTVVGSAIFTVWYFRP